GADLSNVRIHADGAAATEASRVSARAFTRGEDIYFARNAFDLSSARGQRLLAHEVAHTLQQPPGPREATSLSTRGDRSEREADAAADAFMLGAAVPQMSPAPAGAVLREADSAAPQQQGISSDFNKNLWTAAKYGLAGAPAELIEGIVVGIIALI